MNDRQGNLNLRNLFYKADGLPSEIWGVGIAKVKSIDDTINAELQFLTSIYQNKPAVIAIYPADENSSFQFSIKEGDRLLVAQMRVDVETQINGNYDFSEGFSENHIIIINNLDYSDEITIEAKKNLYLKTEKVFIGNDSAEIIDLLNQILSLTQLISQTPILPQAGAPSGLEGLNSVIAQNRATIKQAVDSLKV